MSGRLTGVHRSAQPGISVEFSDHKEYSPGDDIRHLNWKLFARSNKYYVRQFARETHATVRLLVDCSGSMDYRSSFASDTKAFCAARLAALLAYVFLRQKDAVGLLTVSGREHGDYLQPRSHPSHIVPLQEALRRTLPGSSEESGQERATSFSHALEFLIAHKIGHSALIVFSDLFVDPDELFPYLAYLRSGGAFVWLIQLLDPAEWDLSNPAGPRTFPFDGARRFSSRESSIALLMDSALARPAYLARFQRMLQLQQERAAEGGIELSRGNTDEDPVDFLMRYLLERK